MLFRLKAIAVGCALAGTALTGLNVGQASASTPFETITMGPSSEQTMIAVKVPAADVTGVADLGQVPNYTWFVSCGDKNFYVLKATRYDELAAGMRNGWDIAKDGYTYAYVVIPPEEASPPTGSPNSCYVGVDTEPSNRSQDFIDEKHGGVAINSLNFRPGALLYFDDVRVT